MYLALNGAVVFRVCAMSNDHEAASWFASDPTDALEIRRVLEGDENAYARLVTRYQDGIGAYMWRFTRDERQCRELVHDVFVEAYFSLGTYRGQAPFVHWLRRIATRVGYRYWKLQARERARIQFSFDEKKVEFADPGVREEARWQSELIHAALALLSPRDRVVLTLLYLEGMSTKEASDMLVWSHALVRVQAFRAKKKLRYKVEKLMGN